MKEETIVLGKIISVALLELNADGCGRRLGVYQFFLGHTTETQYVDTNEFRKTIVPEIAGPNGKLRFVFNDDVKVPYATLLFTPENHEKRYEVFGSKKAVLAVIDTLSKSEKGGGVIEYNIEHA